MSNFFIVLLTSLILFGFGYIAAFHTEKYIKLNSKYSKINAEYYLNKKDIFGIKYTAWLKVIGFAIMFSSIILLVLALLNLFGVVKLF